MTSASEGRSLFDAQPGEVTTNIRRIDQTSNIGQEAGAAFAGAQDGDVIDMAALGTGHKEKNKRRNLTLWIVLGILAALVVLSLSWFFGAEWYFQDKAALGVELGGTSVAGQNAEQLKTTVNNAVANSKVTVTDGDGKSVTASLADLGVKVDVDATVSQLLAAKSDNAIAKVNPFASQNVSLNATVDKLKLSDYLTENFVQESDRAVASSIAYDDANKTFAATEGKGGRTPEDTGVVEAVNALISEPGSNKNVSVEYKTVDMPISLDAAQKAADGANTRLAAAFTINNGNSKTFTVPVEQVASWITPTGDPSNGTISLSYDKQKIVDYMASTLPEQLNQQMVSQEDVIDGNGSVLLTKVKGVDGVTIKNTDAVADQVYDALTGGQGADVQVAADVTVHDVKQVKSEMRIVVDKTTQTASVYKNDQLVKTFLVCTGRDGGNESDTGTFAIYLKYASQDMTGLNDDGSRYLSKGVKWVSYYNGGEGFHTAIWNYNGIATGDPANHGSHGCINMYEQDSQWIYDNCPEGTIVQVVGTQPTGPVR